MLNGQGDAGNLATAVRLSHCIPMLAPKLARSSIENYTILPGLAFKPTSTHVAKLLHPASQPLWALWCAYRTTSDQPLVMVVGALCAVNPQAFFFSM